MRNKKKKKERDVTDDLLRIVRSKSRTSKKQGKIMKGYVGC